MKVKEALLEINLYCLQKTSKTIATHISQIHKIDCAMIACVYTYMYTYTHTVNQDVLEIRDITFVAV